MSEFVNVECRWREFPRCARREEDADGTIRLYCQRAGIEDPMVTVRADGSHTYDRHAGCGHHDEPDAHGERVAPLAPDAPRFPCRLGRYPGCARAEQRADGMTFVFCTAVEAKQPMAMVLPNGQQVLKPEGGCGMP